MREPTDVTVRRLALASVVANAVIVVTGGAVRLTGSGLGCPTWPRCTDSTVTPTAELASHGLVEFGNRMLTFVLTAVVVATLVAVVRQRPRRRSLVRLATAVLLGIPAQAVLGGITVLTGLNPWTVMAHFLLSMGLLALSVVLLWRTGQGDGPLQLVVKEPLRRLAQVLVGVVAATLAVGTVVTGSGPHSGDPEAGRTGLNPESVSQLHADLVMLLIGLSVATWFALRATEAPRAVVRAAEVLLAVELGQAAIGWTQYFTDLPILLVGAHMAGACLVLVFAVRLLLATGSRSALPAGLPLPRVQDLRGYAGVLTPTDPR